MSGITTGIGIFSGINSAQLIDQLLSIEARPKVAVQRRVAALQQQRAAYLDINSAVLSLRTAAGAFRQASAFRAARAESSNAAVLTATAGTSAVPGSYQFIVKRLVSTQQALTRGFTDADATGVGLTSLTFEIGGGALATETRLSELNGGAGVERGRIVISDASGASATVDLSTAVTVGDVLDAINSAAGLRVRAEADGDRIRVTDLNTSGAGALTIASAAGDNTAASLGIAGSAAPGFGNAITGQRIRTLGAATALSTLNDGRGVNIRDGGDDLVITDREGTVHRIDLGRITQTTDGQTTVVQTRAGSLQEVIAYINAQTGGKVTAALDAQKTGLVLTDTTGGAGNLIVESGANGRTTAQDLGIATAPDGVASSTVAGARLISAINSTLARSLNGGAGVASGAVAFTDRAGVETAVTVSAAALAGSVSDIIRDINDQLQAAGNGVRVALNRAGNGLALADDISGGTGNIAATGAGAQALGIDTTDATGTGGAWSGANLQHKWLGRSTLLSTLNGGKGIGTGSVRITDAAGGVTTISINDSHRTIDDLIQFINSAAGIDIEAAVNQNGDGIVIRDTSGGAGRLRVEDTAGTVARSLNIAGEAEESGGVIEINGSYEKTVSFNASDTLNQIAAKLNSAGVGMTAAVIRDGAGASPFRLSLTAARSGSVGRVLVDTGGFDLGLSVLSRGQDAVAFYGAADPARGVLLSGSSNTLDSVIQGVSIDLRQTSDTPVTLVVSRDTETTEKAVQEFVDAYNRVIDRIARHDSYNDETKVRGALFGDATLAALRTTMGATVQGPPEGVTGQFQRLFQVGVRVGEKRKLTFDREAFRAALEQDPEAVERLFAAREAIPTETQEQVAPGVTVRVTNPQQRFSALGVAEMIAEWAGGMTSTVDGALTRRGRAIDDQVSAQQRRIGAIDIKLAQKRARLERQFTDMERALGALQSQSAALSSLSTLRAR